MKFVLDAGMNNPEHERQSLKAFGVLRVAGMPAKRNDMQVVVMARFPSSFMKSRSRLLNSQGHSRPKASFSMKFSSRAMLRNVCVCESRCRLSLHLL